MQPRDLPGSQPNTESPHSHHLPSRGDALLIGLGAAVMALLAGFSLARLPGVVAQAQQFDEPSLAAPPTVPRPAPPAIDAPLEPSPTLELCGSLDGLCGSDGPSRRSVWSHPTVALRSPGDDQAAVAPASDSQVDPPPTGALIAPETDWSKIQSENALDSPKGTPVEADANPDAGGSNRILVQDESGVILVARLHGPESSRLVILPDGRLAWTRGTLARTSRAFVPLTIAEMAVTLQGQPNADFRQWTTDHYVVQYQGSEEYAKATGQLLESLLAGLKEALAARGVPAREPEFPLVALIFRDETSFRAYQELPEDVQAYYDAISNRIVLFEQSDRDRNAPDVAARKRPQTIAHEGTHQLLQNFGVQPRLASWPLWLTEGLAEYYAPTTLSRDGNWDGGNRINPFHMATLRELKDPASVLLRDDPQIPRISRPRGTSTVEYLITRTSLSATDYALSWALTYYLANQKSEAFTEYLKAMSRREPTVPVDATRELAEFQEFFGEDLAGLDRRVDQYLSRLKGYENLAYYAVTFEQPIQHGVVRRAAMVSQSPAYIRQWIETVQIDQGGAYVWRAVPYPSRAQAKLAAVQWLNSP